MADGRIHPARIEELVEKATSDVEADSGSGETALETGIKNMHDELVCLIISFDSVMGKMPFSTAEVSHLSGIIAGELG